MCLDQSRSKVRHLHRRVGKGQVGIVGSQDLVSVVPSSGFRSSRKPVDHHLPHPRSAPFPFQEHSSSSLRVVPE